MRELRKWNQAVRAVSVLLVLVMGSCRSVRLAGKSGPIDIVIGDPSPRAASFPTGTVRDAPGGRITSIASSPDGKRVYAATLRAGLWRSDDGGVSWRQLGRPQPGDGPQQCPAGVTAPCALPSPFVADVAVSPADPDLVFVASSLDTSRTERDGVYRSTDGGETWQLVHQFSCTLESWKLHPAVGQVVFAPDDPTRLWAAGGCTVAYSAVSGSPGSVAGAGVTRDQIGLPGTWHDAPAATGSVWHVAVGPSTSQNTRRVYACGPRQLWMSTDGGQSFRADTGAGDTGGTADIARCEEPGLQAGGYAGASVLAVDPNDQSHVFMAVGGRSNGPIYFDARSCTGGGTACLNPDGNPCGSGGHKACDQGSLWSVTAKASGGFDWHQEPSPPVYQSAGSHSGSVTLFIHPRPHGGYLLFFSDADTVHVSVDAPTADGWHRLDGPDASALCPSGTSSPTCNRGNTYPHDGAGALIHADTHPVAVDAAFDLTLQAPPSTVPATYRHNTELKSCAGGTIFHGNDGGLVRSTDCGAHFHQASNLTTLIAGELTGVPRASGMPALYFGGPDNDPFYSPDGGSNWQVATDHCGDCQGFYTDALQTRFVVHQVRGPQLKVYQSAGANPPDATDPATQVTTIDLPAGASEMIFAAPGPVIQSLASETPPSEPDLIWPAIDGGVARLWRHKDRSSSWAQEGPDLPSGIASLVAQASGGHVRPVYYLADRTGSDPSDQPNRLWRSHRGIGGTIDGWDCIVPGPAHPGQADGQCAAAPSSRAADGTLACAAGRVCRAWNFAADPYDARVIYISDEDGIKLSLDGGQTWRIDGTLDDWLTADHTVGPDCKFMCRYTDTILRLSGVTFVPDEPEVRFAVGEAGVFVTTNALAGGTVGKAAETWHRLWDSGSMACEPGIPFFTPQTSLGRSLYVPCHGRSLLSFHALPGAGGLSEQLDRSMRVGGSSGGVAPKPGNGLTLPPPAPPPIGPLPTKLVAPPEEHEGELE